MERDACAEPHPHRSTSLPCPPNTSSSSSALALPHPATPRSTSLSYYEQRAHSPIPSPGAPFRGLPPAAPPTPLLWQSPQQLRRHLFGLVDNISLLKAVADELEAVICAKEAIRGCDKRVAETAIESLESVVSVPPQSVSNGLPRRDGEDNTDDITNAAISSFLQVVEKGKGDIEGMESLVVTAAMALQQSVEIQLAPLAAVLQGTARWEDAAAVARLRDSQLKRRRNRRWRKSRRQRAAESLRKERERYDEADQEADEWRARQIAKEIARRKMEKMKEVAKRQAKEERQRLEEELELILIVEKLQELRSLHIQKLKRQGCFFPEEDNKFIERVRAAVEEEERQAVAAADTHSTAVAIAHAEEAGKVGGLSNEKSQNQVDDRLSKEIECQKLHVVSREANNAIQKDCATTMGDESKNIVQDGYGGLPPEFYHYYHGSSADMGTLIEVRRMWDTFIMPGGSRIPGHWIEPPPPADAVWASYLVDVEGKFG